MSNDPIVISGAARTPMGGMMGSLAPLTASELGGTAIAQTIAASGIDPARVDEVIMGNVLGAGQGQAPARQAALHAGLPKSVHCTTINKMCGSGMKAVMFGHDLVKAGSVEHMLVGGMESMTNAPYLMPKGRMGYRFGHAELLDHMALDGLEDAYEKRTPMGEFAERTAEAYGFTREDQDAFAIESLRRAKLANEDGTFDGETVTTTVKTRKGEVAVTQDDQPFRSDPAKVPNLRPAFRKDGTITAATASSISDGAASMLLTSASVAEQMGLNPVAKIVGHASHSRLPAEFTIAPVHAIQSLLDKTGWAASDVDLWEVNEAFAVVAMAAMKDIGIPHYKLNVHGGACALGHPIGASGARILVTLLNAMTKHGAKRGIASLCIGGGEATAVAVERV